MLADASKLDAAAPAWTRMPGPWSLVTDAADVVGGPDVEVVHPG